MATHASATGNGSHTKSKATATATSNRKLPKKPVDGFTFEFWKVYTFNIYGTRPCKVVYHVNTKWDDFEPDRRGGKDIVDDWMFYERDFARSRVCGWAEIVKHLPGGEYDKPGDRVFWTKKEALEYVIGQLQKEIDQRQEHIDQLKKQLVELEDECQRA